MGRVRVPVVCAVLALLAGCSSASQEPPSASPSPSPTIDAPSALAVHCNEDLTITLSDDAVATTPAGVILNVSSDAPAGAYLNYGTGGDELPADPTTWTLGNPPGEMTLSCSTRATEGPETTVDVVDPGGNWSDGTTEDVGCVIGAMPSWVLGGATASTAEDAIQGLIDNFAAAGVEPTLTRGMRVSGGYADAPKQTWVVGSNSEVHMTAVVMRAGDSYESYPDALCVPAPWAPEPVD